MVFETERSLRAGSRHWIEGRLEAAKTALEQAHGARPRDAGATLALARVLSESGRAEDALRLIEEARDAGGDGEVCALFRAVVLCDHGPEAEAAAALEAVTPTNLLARAHLAVLQARELETPATITLPRPCRWIGDIIGRLLAVIETRLFERERDATMAWHHDFLAADARPSDPFEEAFCAGRFEEAARLEGAGGKKRRPDELRAVCVGFTQLALGRPGEALRRLERVAAESGGALGHFFLGAAQAAAVQRREAGWSLSRAARLSDVEVSHVLEQLAERAGWTLALSDED